MPKFTVTRIERVEIAAQVTAEDADAAIDYFDEHYPGLTGFVGNGGSDRLVGIAPSDDGPKYRIEIIEDYMDSVATPADAA